MSKIRIATFNVENLFRRAKAINLSNHDLATDKLKAIYELQKQLKKKKYDSKTKTKIINAYKKAKGYVGFNIFSKKSGWGRYLITQNKAGKYTVHPKGSADWLGVVTFTRQKFSDAGDKNTAKVIKDIKADILCMVEVEDRLVLKQFNADRLKYMYAESMLIDGNDQRGIDVGIYTKFRIGQVWTNIFDGTRKSRTFPRDCLEVQIALNNGEYIYFLINHFTSKAGGSKTAVRRKKQATRVRQILNNDYDLTKDKVVVAGDFNDTPDSASLSPLLSMNDLHDVLDLEFPNNLAKKWTYHYKKNEQIDYLLVSTPLANVFQQAGVFRKGMPDLKVNSGGKEKPYNSVTSWRDAASDHGAVWADFDI